MPTLGPVSMKRLALVNPILAQTIQRLAYQMSETIGVTQGLRTEKEQAALFAQGRQPLDVVNAMRLVVGWAPLDVSANIEPVTKAQPGYSWHEFGLAVDVVPLESSGEPDWDTDHPVWQEIISKGTALGLTSGISWKDEPHFQLTGRFPVTPTDEVREIYSVKGLNGVWQAAQV